MAGVSIVLSGRLCLLKKHEFYVLYSSSPDGFLTKGSSPQPFCCPRIPGTRSQLPQSTCLEIMTLNMLRLGLEQIICREQTVLPEPRRSRPTYPPAQSLGKRHTRTRMG